MRKPLFFSLVFLLTFFFPKEGLQASKSRYAHISHTPNYSIPELPTPEATFIVDNFIPIFDRVGIRIQYRIELFEANRPVVFIPSFSNGNDSGINAFNKQITSLGLSFNCSDTLNPALSTYYDRGICVPGIITNETWFTPAPRNFVGIATWYSPSLMNNIAVWRGMYLYGFVGGVSLYSPSDIGEVVWLRRPGFDWEGPFLVVEASQRNHMFTTLGYVRESVEVDYNTAVRWGMAGWTRFGPHWVIEWKTDDVEVWKGLRPPEGETEPLDYGKWFLDMVEFDWSNNVNWRYDNSTAKIKSFKEYRELFAGSLLVRP